MNAPTTISFFVAGEPAMKGSTKSFPFKGKDGRIHVSTTNASNRTEPWQGRVATEAQRVYESRGVLITVPVEVSMRFYFTRPKSVSVKKRKYPTCKFDLDKLARNVLDGLTGTIYEDDQQVIDFGKVSKRYADNGQAPGCFISVTEVSP